MGRWGRPLSTARRRFAVVGASRAGPLKCQRYGSVPRFAGLVGAVVPLVQARAVRCGVEAGRCQGRGDGLPWWGRQGRGR